MIAGYVAGIDYRQGTFALQYSILVMNIL